MPQLDSGQWSGFAFTPNSAYDDVVGVVDRPELRLLLANFLELWPVVVGQRARRQ